jgi:outer membrane protein TolC
MRSIIGSMKERVMRKNRAGLALVLMLIAGVFPLFAGGRSETVKPGSLEELRAFATPELDGREMAAAAYPGESAPGRGAVGLEGRDEFRSLEEIRVDVDKAVELALDWNLGLKGEQLDLVKKRRAVRRVWNNFVPTVGVSATLGRMNVAPSGGGWVPFDGSGPITDPNNGQLLPFATLGAGMAYGEMDISPWSLSLGVNADLMLNLALFDGISATQLAYESGQISYEQARRKLERDVRKNFYNLLLMQQNRQLFVQQIEAAKDRYDQSEINFRNGLVPELSMLSAQVAWENLKPALEGMDLGYDQALAGFKMTLGLSQDTELLLDGAITVDPLRLEARPLIDEYLAGRLDIQELLYGMKSLDVAKRSTVSRAFTPNLVLGWSYDPTLSDPWEASLTDGDNWAQRSGMLRITVAMNLEGFLPGSKTRVALADLEEDKRAMQLGLMQAIEGAEMEITSLVKSLNRSISSMNTLQLNVELAQRAYGMAEEAYRAGSRELLEVQNAQIELDKANYELLKEQYNYVTGLLDLEYALNTTMEEIKDGIR